MNVPGQQKKWQSWSWGEVWEVPTPPGFWHVFDSPGFLPNSFHGGRMYRTGDMVRFMPLQPWGQLSMDQLPLEADEVVLEFLGRLDGQVQPETVGLANGFQVRIYLLFKMLFQSV